jgi:hypothetical protein
MKTYHSETGVALDANWQTHIGHCERCRKVSAKKPASLNEFCLEGAILWKRDRGHTPRRARPEWRPDTHASKAAVKSATRYK